MLRRRRAEVYDVVYNSTPAFSLASPFLGPFFVASCVPGTNSGNPSGILEGFPLPHVSVGIPMYKPTLYEWRTQVPTVVTLFPQGPFLVFSAGLFPFGPSQCVPLFKE